MNHSLFFAFVIRPALSRSRCSVGVVKNRGSFSDNQSYCTSKTTDEEVNVFLPHSRALDSLNLLTGLHRQMVHIIYVLCRFALGYLGRSAQGRCPWCTRLPQLTRYVLDSTAGSSSTGGEAQWRRSTTASACRPKPSQERLSDHASLSVSFSNLDEFFASKPNSRPALFQVDL